MRLFYKKNLRGAGDHFRNRSLYRLESKKKTPAFFYVTDLLPESSQQAATGVP